MEIRSIFSIIETLKGKVVQFAKGLSYRISRVNKICSDKEDIGARTRILDFYTAEKKENSKRISQAFVN